MVTARPYKDFFVLSDGKFQRIIALFRANVIGKQHVFIRRVRVEFRVRKVYVFGCSRHGKLSFQRYALVFFEHRLHANVVLYAVQRIAHRSAVRRGVFDIIRRFILAVNLQRRKPPECAGRNGKGNVSVRKRARFIYGNRAVPLAFRTHAEQSQFAERLVHSFRVSVVIGIGNIGEFGCDFAGIEAGETFSACRGNRFRENQITVCHAVDFRALFHDGEAHALFCKRFFARVPEKRRVDVVSAVVIVGIIICRNARFA